MSATPDEQLITGVNIREYFQDAVLSALSHQQLRLCDETVIYVTNLLADFLHSERLYEQTDDGYMIKPLASFYSDALDARSVAERDRSLQRLGDVALFISGVFTDSLSRSLVDVDYYIAMGGNAYSYLADCGQRSKHSTALREVFNEIAARFEHLVDVLSEVSEVSNINGSSDMLRLYEVWLHTGSKRAEGKLRELGIHPIAVQRQTLN